MHSHRSSEHKSLNAIFSPQKCILLHIQKGEENCHMCACVRPEENKQLLQRPLNYSLRLFEFFCLEALRAPTYTIKRTKNKILELHHKIVVIPKQEFAGCLHGCIFSDYIFSWSFPHCWWEFDKPPQKEMYEWFHFKGILPVGYHQSSGNHAQTSCHWGQSTGSHAQYLRNQTDIFINLPINGRDFTKENKKNLHRMNQTSCS